MSYVPERGDAVWINFNPQSRTRAGGQATSDCPVAAKLQRQSRLVLTLSDYESS